MSQLQQPRGGCARATTRGLLPGPTPSAAPAWHPIACLCPDATLTPPAAAAPPSLYLGSRLHVLHNAQQGSATVPLMVAAAPCRPSPCCPPRGAQAALPALSWRRWPGSWAAWPRRAGSPWRRCRRSCGGPWSSWSSCCEAGPRAGSLLQGKLPTPPPARGAAHLDTPAAAAAAAGRTPGGSDSSSSSSSRRHRHRLGDALQALHLVVAGGAGGVACSRGTVQAASTYTAGWI